MTKLLQDKVCIITGAGKGFGRDLALTYLTHGAKLALITRTADDIDSLRKEIKPEFKKNCFMVCGDVVNKETINSFIASTVTRFGHIDILVNNAGMRFRKAFLDIESDELKVIMDNNFFSIVYLCQAVLPHMMKRCSGKIINMSSIAGTLGLPELSGYISSKAAILGLTKALAVEFASFNIQVNAIAPGFAKTSYFDRFKQNESLYQFTLDRIPMRRWGESAEIANVCLFLSSSLSDYVTGEVLHADGGWSAW